MENIIGILIIILFFVLAVMNTKKAKTKHKPKAVPPPLPHEVPLDTPPPILQTSSFVDGMKKHKDKVRSKPDGHKSVVPKPGVKVPAAASSEKNETGEEIALQTPADARRAFIYSEIFNRKY